MKENYVSTEIDVKMFDKELHKNPRFQKKYRLEI